MAVHFSPKILGLNTRIFEAVFGQSETDFQTVIGSCVPFFMCYCKKNE